MDKEILKMLEDKLPNIVNDAMESKLKTVVGEQVAAETRKIVEQLAIEKTIFGKDRTGLTDKQKADFAEVAKALTSNGTFAIDTKANEALISEQDGRGGYLVAPEVANAILRIAASVGLVLSQAAKWTMKTDELDIPAYTGAFLEGEYLGFDAAGSITGLNFGMARLLIKKWQLAFVVGNDLLEYSTVELANWLLALGGESLANMIDKQAFKGTGPFVGLLSNPDTTAYVMPTGKTTFAGYAVIDDSSAVIGNLEESVLDGAAFYMNRTVWASLRAQKDTAGMYLLPQAGAATNNVLQNFPMQGGVKPAGEVLGHPVFTTRHLPALSASAVSTKFIVFGNMKAMAYGDKGELRVEQFQSGAFGGKEIALSDQKAIVYKHRHALVTALPAAFVVVSTPAS